jgi:hypothetical protein
MPNYYQVPGYLSVSYLKSLTSTGQSIKLYPESLLFGNQVDCLITGDDITPYLPVPESAYKLAELYKDKRFPIQGAIRYQHEFYKSLHGEKFKGKTDIWYPGSEVVEDIKTTGISTNSHTAIMTAIDRFGYDMQMYAYMNLSKSHTGILTFLSRPGGWMHQIFLDRKSDIYKTGEYKIKKHIELWRKSIKH